MSLICELDLDNLKEKINFLGRAFQKLEHYSRTDSTENITTPHLHVVNWQ